MCWCHQSRIRESADESWSSWAYTIFNQLLRSMSEPFSTFKAVQICPGITLLDLLQLERLHPMRRQAVLPFFQDLCQRKKLLLLESSVSKAWPEALLDQEAIFLLLEQWALFLPLKLNTSLMFGEVTAVLAVAQPTDVKGQLTAFKQ